MFRIPIALKLAGRARLVARWLPLFVACVIPQLANAACFNSPDPAIASMQALAAQDGNAALARADKALRYASSDSSPVHRAWLQAVRAQAFSALELDPDARDAARAGLALVPDNSQDVHLALMTILAENIYDAAGIETQLQAIEAARAGQTAGSVADACLATTLGMLQFRQDRADLAISTLSQAYRASDSPARREQRILTASVLASIMRELGDYKQALSLNSEVIEWNASHDEQLQLSVSRYLRGVILIDMREFDAAVLAFKNARELSVKIGDEQGIAYADMRICESQVETGDIAGATPRCENAFRIFSAARSPDTIKQVLALQARIDLAQGRSADAVQKLDTVLANDAADMPPRYVTPIFKSRAEANAALNRHRAAFDDLSEYMRRYTAQNEMRRIRQADALRARFETDREIERNAALHRELAQSRHQQLILKRWMVVAIGASVLVIGLLTTMLLIARAHRRQLADLANLDVLTGLPNRRRTADLAERSLDQAKSSGQALTAALIDLDHFKMINDHCGHAGGDRVLKDFATIARDSLRDTDTFGRWGGEEFLLVMPNTTLDVALTVVERLRARALTIALPGGKTNLRVSLSAGLATNEADVKSLDGLVARADAALYRAKNEGRNLVRIDEDSIDSASTGVRRSLPSRA
ncbi:MAG TPA: diguanylate cyclase [Steroidobacteraceae bacterium]|nr:diguanylate cyclase [Steroidobacteraceae bacterium]